MARTEISISYPSGKRSELITDDTHQKLCKAIFRKNNVVESVIHILVNSNPSDVVDGAKSVISDESKALCKRNSGALLQNKTYESIMNFKWDKFHHELQIRAPSILKVVSAIVSDIPTSVCSKKFLHILHTIASGLHGRSQEMSALHYQVGFILVHGGCTQHDITRLAKLGISVTGQSVHSILAKWKDNLDSDIIKLRDDWAEGGHVKYQLVGDNWDKNILPSFRTSQQKTISLHLFNTIAVVDRVKVLPVPVQRHTVPYHDIKLEQFIPSVNEQALLKTELVFIFSTAIINNIPQVNNLLKNVYPEHLNHKNSTEAGLKTTQYPLGLFDCNETKTADVIQLLKDLQQKYVPYSDNDIAEPVFFGGDRLTDERIQGAQQAMLNGETATARLEGFISKIEDFHRLMNFLEAICRLSFSTDSGNDRGTIYYYRNILNARNVKGDVKNAYRAYKLLCYTILDAMCCVLFLSELGLHDLEDKIPVMDNFEESSSEDKINWINNISQSVIEKSFFENSVDVFQELRAIVTDPDHPENYWISNLDNGLVKCHFCDKTYTYVGSLKVHEQKIHNYAGPTTKCTIPKDKDELQSYSLMLFKLLLLHKNLDTSVDMADGERSVRSAKYELPIYNTTNKTKYAIGSVHLISMTEGLLDPEMVERLISNRFINLQGGKNNNLALDEYVELLNRDSKVTCSGFQTKESILARSAEFPHLINFTKHFDTVSNVSTRKGFHKLPSYAEDVKKVFKDLIEIDAFSFVDGRKLHSKSLKAKKHIFDHCYKGLGTFIHRHKPVVAFHRLRNKKL